MTYVPRYLDDRQDFLETMARGKPGALHRNLGLLRRYIPSINGTPIGLGDEVDHYERKSDAVAAARQFRDQCRAAIAEANGD